MTALVGIDHGFLEKNTDHFPSSLSKKMQHSVVFCFLYHSFQTESMISLVTVTSSDCLFFKMAKVKHKCMLNVIVVQVSYVSVNHPCNLDRPSSLKMGFKTPSLKYAMQKRTKTPGVPVNPPEIPGEDVANAAL